MRKLDLSKIIGLAHGNLTVISAERRIQLNGWRSEIWCECLCNCGNKKWIRYGNIKNKLTKSCGCYRYKPHKLDTIFYQIKQRCNNPNNHAAKWYHDKGIKCMFKSGRDLHKEVGDRPSRNHSIDRIDSNGNYEPGNIRWATTKEQARNKSNNLIFNVNGECKSLSEWAESSQLKYSTIWARVFLHKWDIERALTQPSRIVQRVNG